MSFNIILGQFRSIAIDLNAKVDSLVGQYGSVQLAYDVDQTSFHANDNVGVNYIKTQQSVLYGKFYRNLLKGTPVQICCMGDSLTYGQDTVSGNKRVADPVPTSNGTSHGATRAATTYPEALQTYLTQVYGSDKVTVINRGYSGDWIDAGMIHWNLKHTSDLTIIMYGTNDSRAAWVPADIRGDIEKYLYWYEQLIIRETLWGKAVIILMPPKYAPATGDKDIESFANALIQLGQRYNVPVIDGEEFTINYPYSIYSDWTHFNDVGYKAFAAKVAALFIGAGANKPRKICGGSKLLVRPTIDNVKYIGATTESTNIATGFTPNEDSNSGGFAASWSTASGNGVIYSFYAEEEDLMILPYYYTANKNLMLTLDFNTINPRYNLDPAQYAFAAINDNTIKQVTYDSSNVNTVTPLKSNWIKRLSDNTAPNMIMVVEKGWHTLLVESTVDGSTLFNGIEFLSFQNYYSERKILDNAYNFANSNRLTVVKLTHANYNDTDNVLTTTFTIDDLKTIYLNLDGTQQWKNPIFSIVVHNWDNSILRYGLVLPQFTNSDTAGLHYWLQDRKDFTGTPTERTINYITFDHNTGVFTINWTGATTRSTEITIKLY